MARPKKSPVKAPPVKRTRKVTAPEPTVFGEKKAQDWYDEQLRKECLGIAASHGSSIATLVEDARVIYYFIKGTPTYSGTLKYTTPIPQEEAKVTSGYINRVPIEGDVESFPETTLTTFPKSKFDAHTL